MDGWMLPDSPFRRSEHALLAIPCPYVERVQHSNGLGGSSELETFSPLLKT